MTTMTIGAAMIIGTAACITDLHSRRIPNWLTFGAAAAAFAFHFANGGQAAAQQAAAGWATGLFLFMPMFLLGGMGAGDVKLLAALGAWLGPSAALWMGIYASMAGGVLAVLVALRHNYLGTALKNVGALGKFWWMVGGIKPMSSLTLERGSGPRLAYAIPVFLGMVMAIWLR